MKVWADTAPGPATAQPPAGKSRAAPGGDEETSSSQEAAAQRTVVTREPVCETQWGGGHQVTVAFINPQFWFSSRGRGLHLHRHTHCKFCLYCFLSASSYLERILNNRALTTSLKLKNINVDNHQDMPQENLSPTCNKCSIHTYFHHWFLGEHDAMANISDIYVVGFCILSFFHDDYLWFIIYFEVSKIDILQLKYLAFDWHFDW